MTTIGSSAERRRNGPIRGQVAFIFRRRRWRPMIFNPDTAAGRGDIEREGIHRRPLALWVEHRVLRPDMEAG